MTETTYTLNTEAGHKLNGTIWDGREPMREAVRAEFGHLVDFGATEGYFTDSGGEVVATFGQIS